VPLFFQRREEPRSAPAVIPVQRLPIFAFLTMQSVFWPFEMSLGEPKLMMSRPRMRLDRENLVLHEGSVLKQSAI